jgi:hypothetical protein
LTVVCCSDVSAQGSKHAAHFLRVSVRVSSKSGSNTSINVTAHRGNEIALVRNFVLQLRKEGVSGWLLVQSQNFTAQVAEARHDAVVQLSVGSAVNISIAGSSRVHLRKQGKVVTANRGDGCL